MFVLSDSVVIDQMDGFTDFTEEVCRVGNNVAAAAVLTPRVQET